VLILVLYKFWLKCCGKCPPNELLLPCICNNNKITCGGNQTLYLWKIFRDIFLNLVRISDESFDVYNWKYCDHRIGKQHISRHHV
jgi:hypothetical protein